MNSIRPTGMISQTQVSSNSETLYVIDYFTCKGFGLLCKYRL